MARRYSKGAIIRSLVTGYISLPPFTPTIVLKIDSLDQGSLSKGVGFPDWRLRISRGESATTSLVGTRYTSTTGGAGHISVRRHAFGPQPLRQDQWNLYEIWGDLSAYPGNLDDPSSMLITSVENEVKRAAVSKIRQAQTTLRGLVAAGEMGQTARMMTSRARSLNVGVFGYLNALRKRAKLNRTGRQDLSKRVSKRYVNLKRLVAGTWLEYSYGWKPLVSDINDGAHALARIQTYRPPSIRIYAQSSSGENQGGFKGTRTSGPMSYTYQTNSSTEYAFKVYGSVNATPHGVENFNTPVLDEFGVRLSEFLPTIWELIPYSFLVDYFANVGNIIDGYSLNTSGVGWLNSGTKKVSKFTSNPGSVSFQALPGGQWDTDKRTYLGGPFVITREYVRRETFDPKHLTPTLEFRIPGTSTKWLNMAALAITHRATSRLLARNGVQLF